MIKSKKPGIYILLGDDKRYIGQASNAIFSRLQQHYINNPGSQIEFVTKVGGWTINGSVSFLGGLFNDFLICLVNNKNLKKRFFTKLKLLLRALLKAFYFVI